MLKNKKHLNITVQASSADLADQAQAIATRLGLSIEPPECSSVHSIRSTEQNNRLLLRVSRNGLELLQPDDPKCSGAVRVDFTAGRAAFRRKQQKKELLVRAVKGRAVASTMPRSRSLMPQVGWAETVFCWQRLGIRFVFLNANLL
ncbi:MAG: hypothetical protein D3913_11560 [Candidatus Electrothrix sp. LOE1_4_5]|nr:hypothetical protein [Candidatus Electrothrix gigas]